MVWHLIISIISRPGLDWHRINNAARAAVGLTVVLVLLTDGLSIIEIAVVLLGLFTLFDAVFHSIQRSTG